MARAVAQQLESEGHPHAAFAARVLAERGRLGLDRTAFADHLGLDEATVAAAEDGALAPAEAPSELATLSLFDDDQR
jgi:hypothetical protein